MINLFGNIFFVIAAIAVLAIVIGMAVIIWKAVLYD